MKKPHIEYSSEPVIAPQEGCAWADTMVLNPALVLDEHDKNTIHMLFRATGPWHRGNLKGLSDPYPIFLGYAKSTDGGRSFIPDFSRPALAPALAYDEAGIYITDIKGKRVINYANGCVEDPRLFKVEGRQYLTVACRLFPPGAYWEGDRRKDNLPDWAQREDNPIGRLAVRNDTVTVLYEVDMERLTAGEYESAFGYVGPLTDGNITDDRDAFLFPRRMQIHGKKQYVMLHRPENPSRYPEGRGITTPSIMISAAERLEDFALGGAERLVLATSEFDWEQERIGASFPPIDIGNGEWLVSYHGKQMPDYGYTQSFMILKETADGFPVIEHRLSERLIYAQQKWELPDKFPCPCIFTTGGVVIDDELIMGYGAADQKVGIARTNLQELIKYVKRMPRGRF